MGDLGWDPRWKVDNNKKSEYRLYILDGIDVKFLVCFWCLQLTVKWMGHKKKKKGTYIFSEANVTKCLLLNLDEGIDYSFYYSFNFL